MKTNRFNFPDLGLGVGLRTVHFDHILNNAPRVDWFEIITENYIDTGGRIVKVLDEIAERYPVVMHGVSMSIGSTDPLDIDYLKKIKALADRIRAPWVSDHLCWTGISGINVHDLLPIPFNEEVLEHVIGRVKQASDILERPLVLENQTTYAEFATSTMTEWQFFSELLKEADCAILLDVNNVYVSAYNHGYDAKTYISAIPPERVVQYHLAGHTNQGTHIIDTHNNHVINEVWELYRFTTEVVGKRPTLLEWDADIPAFDVVHNEVLKAKAYIGSETAAAVK